LEKWKQTEALINLEISKTSQILNLCLQIKNCPLEYDKKQADEFSVKTKENIMVIPNSDGKPKRQPVAKSKNRESAGDLKKDFLGGDFKNLNNIIDKIDKIEKDEKVKNTNNRYVNVSASKDHINIDKKLENLNDQLNKEKDKEKDINPNINKNENLNSVDENFIVYKKPVNNMNLEKKHPMVWDPPEEKRGELNFNVLVSNSKLIRNGGNPIKRSTPPRLNRKVNGNK
jgi:hypothetical protein